MKINSIPDLEKFFKIIEQCEGQVHARSPEGDDIVLNSKLSRIMLSAIPKDELSELNLELHCDNPGDVVKFIKFMME